MKQVRRQSIRTLTALVVTLVLLLTASIAMATDESSVGRIQVANHPTVGHPTGGLPTGGFPTGGFPTGGFPTGGEQGWPWGHNDGPCDHKQYPEREHHSRRDKIKKDTVTVDPVVVVEEVPLVVPKTGTVDNTSMAIGILLMLVSAAGIALVNRARVSAK